MNTSIKFGEVLGRFGLENDMTRDEVIRMAREAGCDVSIPGVVRYRGIRVTGLITRFAAIVAAAEREACAKVCEDNADCCNLGSPLYTILSSNAAAIRARGNK